MIETLTFPDLGAYHSAIIRIATVRDRSRAEPPYLLFASVELITSSRPVPDTMPVDKKGVPQAHRTSDAKYDLAFRRVAMGATDAVDWYRSLRSKPTLPIPQCDADRGQHDGKPIQTSGLADEPVWPSFSTPLPDPSLFGSADDLYPTPFIGFGANPVRVHRQLAVLVPFVGQLAADRESQIWLQRRIHFDIVRHDELLGGAVLVVPDPDVRTVSTFMARNEAGREHLVGEVRPRRGRSLQGFTLTLFEERFGAMHIFKSFEVDDGLMVVQSDDQLEHTGHALSHSERGLVHQQKALPYLRTIGLNFNVANRRVQVETRDDRRKGVQRTTHQIDEVARSTDSVISLESDIPRTRDAASRFYANAERRRGERQAQQLQLKWFDQRGTALQYIREQIGSAREEIMIVDPYADEEDLFNFGHFVTRRDIKLRLLTSRLPFGNRGAMSSSFDQALQSFEQRGLPAPEIKVLRGGNNPPIHDRFLVIDGNVWLSGNSLNAIGSRASVMLKLPDSANVRTRLEQFFQEARHLQVTTK